MSEAPQDNHTPDEPRISANQWYALAVTGAILAATGFVIAFIWVFWLDGEHDINERAQAVAPFGAAAIAIVTFFTIAWRGIQTDHQLRQQAEQVRFQGRQLEQIVRQNDAKEDENLVKVLQEGAKLIADPEKPSQVLAGISSLEYLVTQGKEPFNIQAADLIANLLMQIYDPSDLDILTRAAFNAMHKCEQMKITTNIDAIFKIKNPDDNGQYFWPYFPAIKSIVINGGKIRGKNIELMSRRIQNLFRVEIHEHVVDFSNNIYRICSFVDCKVNKIEAHHFRVHKFKKCDFSDAMIKMYRFIDIDEEEITIDLNYYREGHPPRDQNGNNLEKYFLTYSEYCKKIDEIPF